jgi:predicted homoserine dehydrogenase-like protein
MEEDIVNVGIVGEGRTGLPLLKELFNHKYIKVIGVADLREDAPGIELAKKKKVFTTKDYMDLAAKGEEIDIIIDVTGDHSVSTNLKMSYVKNKNFHTIIMPELIARLMVSMSRKLDRLMESYHPLKN